MHLVHARRIVDPFLSLSAVAFSAKSFRDVKAWDMRSSSKRSIEAMTDTCHPVERLQAKGVSDRANSVSVLPLSEFIPFGSRPRL
jgi:hypothetical protein